MEMEMISDRERAFLMRRRFGHLATADRAGAPHLVPVCYTFAGSALYTAIDEKPKRGRALRQVINIAENPRVAFLADHYDEDWSRLGWLMIDGRAEIINAGAEFDRARVLLTDRYKQYATMRLSPVIAVRVVRVRSWGDLDR